MSTTRTVIRTALIVSLAAAVGGCIIVPRDPWGGHGGKHRRGGHHLDQPVPHQAPVSEPGYRRPDGGRR